MHVDLAPFCGKRVCVALSGGGDSVALFHYFRTHAEECGIALSAVNVEHGIRGAASLRDTAFVKELCAREGVPLFCFSADIPALAAKSGRGLEEEARLFRRSVFERLLREDRADFVATAHHAGDNAESVLFNLFRGASLTGAGGIHAFVPVCGQRGIVRPLLGVPEAELSAYLREHALAHCEDESNADEAYTRNFLRRRVLAPAKERFPHAEERLYAFSQCAREDDAFLYGLAAQQLQNGGGAAGWRLDLPEPLFRRCFMLAMRGAGAVKDVTQAHVAAVLSLRKAQSGARVTLPAGLYAVREYDTVRLVRRRAEAPPEQPFCTGTFAFAGGTLTVKERAAGGEGFKKGKALVLDADALPQGCVLRTPREGDVFRKFGGGTKKLKAYLVDRKIPARVRAGLPVLACGSEVLAVCGVEIAASVKMTEKTQRVFEITYEEKDHAE